MTNYDNGKIYKIESNLGDLIYIGSTTKKYLSSRISGHRYHYKQHMKDKANYLTLFKLFNEYGLENCKIVLVENYPCESKDELRAREAYYIKNTECVNKHIPNRTRKEWQDEHKEEKKLYDKTRYENKKEEILEKCKEYRMNHKEQASAYNKKYRELNREKLINHSKNYYYQNKK